MLIKANARGFRHHALMSSGEPLELDVRPMFSERRPPLSAVLDAAGKLTPGQALRLIAPIEPVPLYDLLALQGFSHETTRNEAGDWVVHFRR